MLHTLTATFFLASCFILASIAKAEDRPIVAVFDIEMRNVGPAAKKANDLTDYLCSLLAGKGFQIVPRAKLKESLLEKKKESYKQCYDQACQIEIGQELAAQKSLAAQVLSLGGKCKVTLTLYDLKRSTSEKGATVSGGCDEPRIVESLEGAVEQLVGGASAAAPIPAPSAEKGGVFWVKSEPAKIEFTKSEVTVAQYRACVNAGKCSAPESKDTNEYCTDWGNPERDNYPVTCVDWNQADSFCKWAGGRLPTDAEWYAEASDGGKRKFPWGDAQVTCDLAVWDYDYPNKSGCGTDSTWPVCSKARGNSISGLCDMSGNVWEWTASSKDSDRGLRGGSNGSGDPEGVQASYRRGQDPFYKDSDVGFRCARSNAGKR